VAGVDPAVSCRERAQLGRGDVGGRPDQILEEAGGDRLLAEERWKPCDRHTIRADRAKHREVGIGGGAPIDPGSEGFMRHERSFRVRV
jgi:hypothetical protein